MWMLSSNDKYRKFAAVIGALAAIFAGISMLLLRSQAGNTVAEAFYQMVGLMSIGLAVLLFGLCMFLEKLTEQNAQVIELLRGMNRGAVSQTENQTLPPLL